jgi:hypothetical protein
MEKTSNVSNVSKSSKSKKGISYVTLSSATTKLEMINALNAHANSTLSGGSFDCQIPSNPDSVPNISFWIENETARIGVTITIPNCKWGWQFFDDQVNGRLWQPTKDTSTNSSYKRPLKGDEERLFTRILKDNCSNYSSVANIIVN